MESLMAAVLCGTIYHLFAGQPLTIIATTGPLLVFEGILYQVCRSVLRISRSYTMLRDKRLLETLCCIKQYSFATDQITVMIL